MRLGLASRKFNVGHNTILDFLAKKGHTVENNPNAKLTPEQVSLLSKEYASSASEKQEASGMTIGGKHSETVTIKSTTEPHRKKNDDEQDILIKNLGSKELKHKEEAAPEKVVREKPKLEGLKVVASSPARLARPEAEKPCSAANVSKARQTSSCFIADGSCNRLMPGDAPLPSRSVRGIHAANNRKNSLLLLPRSFVRDLMFFKCSCLNEKAILYLTYPFDPCMI